MMIKFAKLGKIAAGVILAAAMAVFTFAEKSLFVNSDNEFQLFPYIQLYIFAAGVFIFSLFDYKKILKRGEMLVAICAVAFVPFIMMQMSMVLAGNAEFSMGIYLMNVLLYFLPMLIAFIATNSFPVSATISIVISAAFNIASYVLNNFRGTPFIPTDLLAIGTAVTVAANYVFTFEWQLVYAIVMTAFSIFLVWAFPLKIKFKRSPIICRGAAAAIFLIICFIFSLCNFSDISMDVFDQYHANNTHGTAYSFFINCCKMRLEKPSGYKEKDIKTMLSGLEDDTEVPENKPNIIVIMNESYSDLQTVGEFETNVPYNKFFMSLKENTLRGELLVSPFGGYTCNTEFEFLSGLSMGLLPQGGTPYLQYINKKCPYFLPDYLNSLGYKTIALHPYYARCWNRETVYKHMNFDEFISIENMGDYQDESAFESVRSYLSDNTSFSAIINQFEQKDDDERLFLFNVTMQNHGGYTYSSKNYEDDVHITSMSGTYPQTEQYLSMIKRTDEAFEILVDYFKKYDEPTIIVMFGDHQPGIEHEFYEELYGKTLEQIDTEELLKRYKVPFIIWSNFDTEEKTEIKTSPNYLSKYVLDVAGLPKNKINRFLDTIQDEIPQINALGHYDINWKWSANDVTKSDALEKYNMLEYYMLEHKLTDEDTPQ